MSQDAIPMIFFDSKIYTAGRIYIRVTSFASPDRLKLTQIVESGETPAGPWLELRSWA